MSEPLLEVGNLPNGAFGRALNKVAQFLAYIGGLVLVAITLMSAYSISMRSLFDAPLLGDVELVQMGCGIAIMLFLPLGQLHRSNVIVDVFTLHASSRTRASLDILGGLLMAACAALLAWRSAIGLIDTYGNGEESIIMGLPLWWSMWAFPLGFALLAVSALYTAWQDFAKEARA